MKKITVRLDICTLYNGLPHGIAFFSHIDSPFSFRGLGMFVHGKLHNAPFMYFNERGSRFSFSMMHNGRPADGCMYTKFCERGDKHHVDSLEEETDVDGW